MGLQQKRSIAGITACLLILTALSCATYSKVFYMQPSGVDSAKWEMARQKNGLDFRVISLTKQVNDSVGNPQGVISLEFSNHEKIYAKPQYLVFFLALTAKQDGFVQRFDLDSIRSRQIQDSLYKQGAATSVALPYSKIQMVTADSTYIPVKVSEFFMGYPRSAYRGFRLFTQKPVPENTQFRIITGDIFLDKVLKDSYFVVKKSTILNTHTHIN